MEILPFDEDQRIASGGRVIKQQFGEIVLIKNERFR